jgi:hypothetical protein
MKKEEEKLTWVRSAEEKDEGMIQRERERVEEDKEMRDCRRIERERKKWYWIEWQRKKNVVTFHYLIII